MVLNLFFTKEILVLEIVIKSIHYAISSIKNDIKNEEKPWILKAIQSFPHTLILSLHLTTSTAK
jgi:hypothetical protein